MKMKSITSDALRVPLGAKTFFSSQAAFPERNSYLVRVETNSGLVGWGEGGQYGPAEPVASCVDHVLAPRLIGRDPTEPVRLWEERYSFSRDFGQKGTYIEAISALDIAFWDVAGKAVGLPVWKLLGGRFKDRITAYATGCYYPEQFTNIPRVLDALEQEASGYADSGFELLKPKIGLLPLADDIERLRVIRNAIGPEFGLLVDANHAYTAAAAMRMGRLMEAYDIRFFEEPVVPEDRDRYRQVRAKNPIAIAGGEYEFTRFGFRDLIAGGCAEIVQPDFADCGGFSAFVQVQALASAYGIASVPHVWGSGIAFAAAVRAIAAIPPFPHSAHPIALLNQPVIEFDRKHNPLRDELIEEPFLLEKGAVIVPNRPGLGVTVRRDRSQILELTEISMRFVNKNVLITGAAAGLGKVIATTFAHEGADVFVLDRQPADETAAAITADGRRAASAPCDVPDEKQVERGVDAAADFFQRRIDVRINNAGFNGHYELIEDIDLNHWRETLDINLTGTMLVTRAALPLTIARKSGAIGTTAANVSRRGLPRRADYVCAKWAILGLNQTRCPGGRHPQHPSERSLPRPNRQRPDPGCDVPHGESGGAHRRRRAPRVGTGRANEALRHPRGGHRGAGVPLFRCGERHDRPGLNVTAGFLMT